MTTCHDNALTVLHLTTFLQGGAGRCIVDLAMEQRASGMHPIVVTSATGEAGYENYPDYLAALRDANIPLYLLDSLFKRDLASNLSVVKALSGILPPGEMRLVHAHASTPALIGLLLTGRAARPMPVVQTMHGWGIRKTSGQKAADLAVMGIIDAVVTTSGASKRLLASMGLPEGTIHVIPCGLAAKPPALPADEVGEELQLARNRGARVILCIGSVNVNKNQQLLLESLPVMQQKQPMLCGFIGEGPGIPELARRAEELNIGSSVRFFGYRPHAASYLGAADLLVAPSQSEGQGLVVLEAFRAGVLAVVSDTPAFQELVSGRHRGVTFESGSREGLASALCDALTLTASQRETIVRRAHEYFVEKFTTRAMHEDHNELYRTILSGHPSTCALAVI